MLKKITFHIILLIFSTGIASAQSFESVKKEAEKILIALSDGVSVNPTDLTEMKKLLSPDKDENESGLTPTISQQSIDSLTNHLTEFESELKKISTDSAFVLFNEWYLHFQNIFYEFSKEKFFSSTKTKLLLFSTSMSCYCTLKMCRNQAVDIIKYVSENTDKYEYWIIDSYWHNELQIEYETLFAPSVIVFNGSNQALYKIEYEEKMLTLLSDYFISIKN
jgi:hypothetical protein